MKSAADQNDREKKPLTLLVFGGSGTIGRAIAIEFAQQGWRVGIHYHQNRSAAEETAMTIDTNKGNAQLYQANITDSSQVGTLLESFLQVHGRLDLVIWAIGVAPSQLLLKTTANEWEQCVQTNLTGAFHVLRAVGPIFQRQQDGAAILLGSLSGEQGIAGQNAYAATKAGLVGLMRTVAQEWGRNNIRINVVFPGWQASTLSVSGINSALIKHQHLLGRTPSLNQVVKTMYHLSTLRDVSGQIWNLDNRLG